MSSEKVIFYPIAEVWEEIERSYSEEEEVNSPVFCPLYAFQDEPTRYALDQQLLVLAKSGAQIGFSFALEHQSDTSTIYLLLTPDTASIISNPMLTAALLEGDQKSWLLPLVEVYPSIATNNDKKVQVFDVIAAVMFHLLCQRGDEAKANVGIINDSPTRDFIALVAQKAEAMCAAPHEAVEIEPPAPTTPIHEMDTAEHAIPNRSTKDANGTLPTTQPIREQSAQSQFEILDESNTNQAPESRVDLVNNAVLSTTAMAVFYLIGLTLQGKVTSELFPGASSTEYMNTLLGTTLGVWLALQFTLARLNTLGITTPDIRQELIDLYQRRPNNPDPLDY